MTWEVFTIDDTTLRPTARALADAFVDDPLFRFLAADEDALHRWLPAAQEANLRMTLPDGHTYGLRAPSGEVVGGLCMLPPGRFPPSIGRNLAFLWALLSKPRPWIPIPGRALRRGAPYLAAWDAMHYPEPHWYLYNLGVAKHRQGEGGGRRLVEHALALAAVEKLPVYLETQTESNLGFYRRMGFEVTDRKEPHPRGPGTWGLLRT
ncbi:MAG: GNAT family N-acetyltransferase [Myxococcota bacterium]